MHTKNKKSIEKEREGTFLPRKYRQSAGEFVFFSIGAMTVIQPYGRIIQLECILM